MKYRDLREFIANLEELGELKRVTQPVSPNLEMTAFCDKVLQNAGPAILFENPTGYSMPVLGNLFGTTRRVALGMGHENISELRQVGELLAELKEPQPPKGLKDAWSKLPMLKQLYNMLPKVINKAPVHQQIINKEDVDLAELPIWHCHSEDIAPLITWGLVVTRGPNKKRQNLGIYRQQVIAKNKVIMPAKTHQFRP